MRMPTPTGTSVRLIVNITCCLATSTVPKSSERGDCWCGGAECNSVYVRQSNLEGGAGPEITSTAIHWQWGAVSLKIRACVWVCRLIRIKATLRIQGLRGLVIVVRANSQANALTVAGRRVLAEEPYFMSWSFRVSQDVK